MLIWKNLEGEREGAFLHEWSISRNQRNSNGIYWRTKYDGDHWQDKAMSQSQTTEGKTLTEGALQGKKMVEQEGKWVKQMDREPTKSLTVLIIKNKSENKAQVKGWEIKKV